MFLVCQARETEQTKCYIFINQEKYLESVLNRFGMQDCKPVSTPLEPGVTFHKRLNNKEPCDKRVYQQAIGCLTYVSTATRPDIAAAVFCPHSCQIQAKNIGQELNDYYGTLKEH